MLVLTLSEGDFIQIDEDIRVYIDCTAGDDALSIAINAPKELKILRGKLYEEKNPHKRDAGVPHKRNNRRKVG